MITYPFKISKHGTDLESPLRQPQIGVQTTVLSHAGSDLAAALQTILEIGDETVLRETITEAFGGATLLIEAIDILFSIRLQIARTAASAPGTGTLGRTVAVFMLIRNIAEPPPAVAARTQ